MDQIRYDKSGVWIAPVDVLLCLLGVITAQPDCGGKTNQTAENNGTWVTDANYIWVGQKAKIVSVQAYSSYLHNLGFFPKPLNKSCYELPVAPNVPYLLRLWFEVGNYTGFKQLPISIAFSIETLVMVAMVNGTISKQEPIYYEEI